MIKDWVGSVMLSMLSMMMVSMKGMTRMTNDEAYAFLGGSVNDQSSAASPRQTAVKPLTDDCDDDKSSDDADEGKENKKRRRQ